MIDKRKWLCVGSMLAMTTTTPALAAETIWTGTTSTNWFDASNWSAGVPAPNTNDPVIDTQTPKAAVIDAQPATIRELFVGVSNVGNGALTIRNGGTLSLDGSALIAYDSNTTGHVVVDGAGSSMTAPDGGIYIGVSNNAQGTLTISNGGTVSAAWGYAGAESGGQATVTVDGAGSTWTAINNIGLGLGASSKGVLTLSNGGVASTPELILGSMGLANVGLGSVSNESNVPQGAGIGILNIGAASGQTAVAPGTLSANSVSDGGGTGSIVFNHTSSDYTFAPTILGTLTVTVEAGTTILAAANTYTGATTINGGTLLVNGSALDSLISVNSGGTLGGSGTVGAVQINAGGTLAPGNGTPNSSLNMSSGLTLSSGSIYLVQVNPTTASYANVTGTATLGGATVRANFATGTYVAKQYKILSASDAVSGTFNSTVAGTNQPSNIKTSLSYDAHNAYLDLALSYVVPEGLNTNQQNVANALTQSFNTNGGISTYYAALSSSALAAIPSPTVVAIQQTSIGAAIQFLALLTAPPSTPVSSLTAPRAGGFADEQDMAYAAKRNPNNALAAIYTKTAPATLEQRWNVWAAGFGGSQTTDGNATVGSSNTTSRVYGTAVGANYRFSPYTIAGFALAGGGTNFSVANSGTGRSDMFQAGAFVRHDVGAAYLSGALAYGWQDVTTDRTLYIAGIDQLRGRFNVNSYSGRIESGYRFVAPVVGGIGFTPYAAGQFTTLDLPAYAESVLAGTNAFALALGAKSFTDSRSELGVRTDKSYAMSNAVLTLTGRAAWAHDFNPNRTIGATFQALPGASFVINGAAQASESALLTAAAEVKWTNGWSTAATFEGEFSNVTRSYAGKALVRYAW